MSQKITRKHLKIGFRVIWGFIAERKNEVILLSLINVLLAIGNGLVPYITGKLFDAILNPHLTWSIIDITLPQIIWLLVSLATIQIVLATLSYNNYARESKINFFARHDYQVKAYNKLLNLPLGFHKKHKIGSVISKIQEAGWGMQVLCARLISSVGADLMTVVVAVVIIFIIEPIVAIFAISGLVIYISIALFNLSKTANLESRFYQAWDKAHGDASDAITNINTVKQATSEEYEQSKNKQNFFTKLFPLWMHEDSIWRSLHFSQQITIVVIQLVVFLWSIRLVIDGSMTIGQLIAFNSYLSILFGPFVKILDMSKTIQSGIININNVENILITPSEKYSPGNEARVAEIKGGITFDNVSFGYQAKNLVIKNINFQVKPGQVVALVGESGVGKSTLIDLISGYHFPTSGKVLIDGINVKRLNLKFLRSNIATVPQEVVLFNDSILTNIKYGNFKASLAEVKEAAKQAHAIDFIEKFPKKWKQIVGERGVKLSVGQKQRVAIARAILRNPKILILDEPTSALDAKSEKIIQESLEKLMAARTTFVIAHRLSTVRQADLILVFKEGEIIERGTHAELMSIANGHYRHLYNLQIGLHA